ncbi:MAG: hypothetical protein ACRC6V_19240 [Bacteroidales bacterium]
MKFKKIKCIQAFYDPDYATVFYGFQTDPQVGHGEWAISEGGDVAMDLRTERTTQVDYPNELLELLEYIPANMKIEGLED